MNPKKIVAVHGSLGRVECEFCQTEMNASAFRSAVELQNIKDIYDMDGQAPKSSSNIHCNNCKLSGVKPATVLYGGNLPSVFFECLNKDKYAIDLLLICGTSLNVYPAASLPQGLPKNTTKCLINLEPVNTDINIFLQGKSDEVFSELIDELGMDGRFNEIKSKSFALQRTRTI